MFKKLVKFTVSLLSYLQIKTEIYFLASPNDSFQFLLYLQADFRYKVSQDAHIWFDITLHKLTQCLLNSSCNAKHYYI